MPRPKPSELNWQWNPVSSAPRPKPGDRTGGGVGVGGGGGGGLEKALVMAPLPAHASILWVCRVRADAIHKFTLVELFGYRHGGVPF